MYASGWDALRMSGSGRESLPVVRDWSGRTRDVQEWSGGPPRCPGVVVSPSRMSGNGPVTLGDVRE